jgi:hypothetical protein
MGEENKQRPNGHGGKNRYAVACSIIGSIISILMGYGNEHAYMHQLTLYLYYAICYIYIINLLPIYISQTRVS